MQSLKTALQSTKMGILETLLSDNAGETFTQRLEQGKSDYSFRYNTDKELAHFVYVSKNLRQEPYAQCLPPDCHAASKLDSGMMPRYTFAGRPNRFGCHFAGITLTKLSRHTVCVSTSK